MIIVIVDRRKGTEWREEQRLAVERADVVISIKHDMVVTRQQSSEGSDATVEFIELVHRDVISGEKSAAVMEEINSKRGTGHEQGQREEALGKAFDALGTDDETRSQILLGDA